MRWAPGAFRVGAHSSGSQTALDGAWYLTRKLRPPRSTRGLAQALVRLWSSQEWGPRRVPVSRSSEEYGAVRGATRALSM